MLKRYRFIFALIWLLLPAAAWAAVPPHAVTKHIIRSYDVKAGTRVNINNQYGNVVLKGWKQGNLLVKITVGGRAANLSRANKLLRLVTIKSRRNTGEVNLETSIDTAVLYLRLSPNDECHISYQVFVPAGLKLSVKNSFGNIQASGVTGELTIDEKFGDLKVANLTGPLNLNVQQGNTDIDRLSNSLLKIRGFNTIRIGTISGDIDATFSSGGRVDVGLSETLHKLSILADNVKPLCITNLKFANADLKIHTTLSKIIYNDHILLGLFTGKKPLVLADSVATARGDTSRKTREGAARLKKLKFDVILSKAQDFDLKTGTGATPLTIKGSFSVLDIRD